MLFSIITVVYNSVDAIKSTIESVINQSFKDFEYLIIDGGSVDGTLQVIQNYSGKINKVISEPDKGIYDAMNKGVLLASGSYILFMNAGDVFVHPNTLKHVSQFSVDDYSVLYGNTILFDSETSFEQKLIAKDLNCLWKSLGYCGLCHQSVFVKRELLKKYPFSLDLKIVADFEQILTLFQNGYRFFYIDIHVARISQDGISSKQFVRSKLDSFGVVKQKYSYLALTRLQIWSFYTGYITIKYGIYKLKEIFGAKTFLLVKLFIMRALRWLDFKR